MSYWFNSYKIILKTGEHNIFHQSFSVILSLKKKGGIPLPKHFSNNFTRPGSLPSTTFAANKHSKTIMVMKRILLSTVLLLACGAAQAQFNICPREFIASVRYKF